MNAKQPPLPAQTTQHRKRSRRRIISHLLPEHKEEVEAIAFGLKHHDMQKFKAWVGRVIA